MPSCRWLAVLLALYAGLDFANPLMPGAVYFDHGVVSVVDGARVAPGKPAVMPPTESSAERPVASLISAPLIRASGAAVGARPWRAPAHRPDHRAADPPPLPDDH